MKRLLVTAILLLLQAAMLYPRDFTFTRINTANSNLSYDGVNVIKQDSRGFIWVGTYKGLNRYDGNDFKCYFKEDIGLSSDMIYVIEEDRDGNVWVGTDRGASRYDYTKDEFEPIDFLSRKGTVIHNKVTNILADDGGLIYLLVNNQGVFIYDTRSGELDEVPYSSFDVIGFRKIMKSSSGNIWLSCYHLNLFVSDSSFGRFRPVDLGEQSDFFLGDEIEGLFESASGMIYVTSTKHGISVIDPESRSVRNLFILPPEAVLISSFMEKKGERIWLSTTKGVFCYDPDTSESFHISEDKTDRFSILGNYVNCTIVDKDGGIWVGTKDGGLSYSGLYQNNFQKTYRTDKGSLEGSIISGFAADGGDKLWVASEQNGLMEKNLKTGSLTRILPSRLPSTICSPCFVAPYLWFGSLEGLYRLDTRDYSVKYYGVLKRTSGINDPRVYLVRKTRDGELYAGTTLGLFRYVKGEDRFEDIDVFDGVFITDLAEDAEGELWISSFATGIYAWDYKAGKQPVRYTVENSSGLRSNKCTSLYVDSQNRVWAIGFSHGMAVYDPQSDSFKVIDHNSLPQLPTDVFFRALEDKEGQLWISSDAGLIQYDPRTREVKIHTIFDGLLENTFSNSALCLDDGSMYFGSINGFVNFSPSGMYESGLLPELVVTSVRIGEREARLGQNPDLLDEIQLKSSEHSFGFGFSFPGSTIPVSTRVQCRLDGYEDRWRDILADRSVFYYDVGAGKYSLVFRASSQNGEWQQVHKPLGIVVARPFILTLPGMILLVVIMSSCAVLAVWIVRRQARRNRERQEREYRKLKDEELFQDKMNFFAHVIHEIKTPLTLIKTPLVNVMSHSDYNEETRKELEVMNNSTTYLSKLINELLDYVRVEKKGYVLNRETVDLTEKLKTLLFDFSVTATNKNIAMDFSSGAESVWVSADMAALDKILNNLLLNAVNHAEKSIEIKLYVEGPSAVISVSNDGNVIPEEYRESIFKPFFQYGNSGSQSKGGVGIGLPLARTLAQMHSGSLLLAERDDRTEFVLSLPLESEVVGENRKSRTPDSFNTENSRPVLLIADDNKDLAEYLQTRLNDEYDTIVAHNGNLALGILKERNVDFLVTDISMPGMNGLELCAEVRKDIEISHIPIVILSARASVESKIQAMESGADLYIEKPFDMEYLKTSIRNILDRRQLLKNALTNGLVGVDIDMFGLPKKDEEFFARFDSLIRENLSASFLSVDWLAEQMNMSQSTLMRKIKKLLNTSPNNYIRSVRLSVAAGMLKDSHGNNITEIGYQVGFSNVSYFAKCFKEQYGKTPTEYAGQG